MIAKLQSRKHIKNRLKSKAQNGMVPLIDVVFLLLIFFIMTVNFSQQEGFLAAELPGEPAADDISEVEPLIVYVSSSTDGQCRVNFSGTTVNIPAGSTDFRTFKSELAAFMANTKRLPADPVMLIDFSSTSWQHMMNVYDSLTAMGYNNIVLGDN